MARIHVGVDHGGYELGRALQNPLLPPAQRAQITAIVGAMTNLATNPSYANLPFYFAVVNPASGTRIADQGTFTEELHHQNRARYLIVETNNGKPAVVDEWTISAPIPVADLMK